MMAKLFLILGLLGLALGLGVCAAACRAYFDLLWIITLYDTGAFLALLGAGILVLLGGSLCLLQYCGKKLVHREPGTLDTRRADRIIGLLSAGKWALRCLAAAAVLFGTLFQLDCEATGFFVEMLAACLLMLYLSAMAAAVLKDFASRHVVWGVLGEALDQVCYRPEGHLPEQHLRRSDMGIYGYNRVSGNDYVTGFYRGMPIAFSDITLVQEDRERNEKDELETRRQTRFRGHWILLDTHRELPADVRVWKREIPGKAWEGTLSTGLQSFLLDFHAEPREEAGQVLTSRVMAGIREVEDLTGGKAHIRFDRSGQVQVAVRTRKDLFEVGTRNASASRLRSSCREELRRITDILDILVPEEN